MFQKILLPIDLTDRHERALETVIELARAAPGEVRLLHVIEVIPGLPQEEEQAFYARLEQKARKHLAGLSETLRARGIACREEVQVGNRVAAIVRSAIDQQVDLIVLTAPRFDPQAPGAGWGSLSYKVGILAPCPVLLVKASRSGG